MGVEWAWLFMALIGIQVLAMVNVVEHEKAGSVLS